MLHTEFMLLWKAAGGGLLCYVNVLVDNAWGMTACTLKCAFMAAGMAWSGFVRSRGVHTDTLALSFCFPTQTNRRSCKCYIEQMGRTSGGQWKHTPSSHPSERRRTTHTDASDSSAELFGPAASISDLLTSSQDETRSHGDICRAARAHIGPMTWSHTVGFHTSFTLSVCVERLCNIGRSVKESCPKDGV